MEQKLKKIRGKQFEKELRKNATPAEKKFRYLIRTIKQDYKLKFRMEFQKGWYQGDAFFISDFYFPESKHTVELDGRGHESKRQSEKDKAKSTYLHFHGIQTIRYTNQDIYNMSSETLFRDLILKGVI